MSIEMSVIGNIDENSRTRLAGWVGNLAFPDESLLVLLSENDRVIHCTLACRPRHDLKNLFADTRKGFLFDLTDIQTVSGRLDLAVMRLGALGTQASDAFLTAEVHSSLELSKERWRGAEPAHDLTFGMMLSGIEFFDFIARYAAENPTFTFGRTTEIGPGYGRLYRHAISIGADFSHYRGLDISASRVEALNGSLGSATAEFVLADIMEEDFGQPFDTLLCSSTFEHFYPDCAPVLERIKRELAPGGVAFLDFPNFENDETFSAANFAQDSGEYVRCYSKAEILSLCNAAGLVVERFEALCFRSTTAPVPAESDRNQGSLVINRAGAGVGTRRFIIAARHKG